MNIQKLRSQLFNLSSLRILVLLLTALVIFAQPTIATALSAEQRALYSSGINYFDYESCSTGTAEAGLAAISGNSNVEKVYNFLVGNGLASYQAAGVIGNLQYESGDKNLDPQATQDNGNYKDGPVANVGYGLAQWTSSGRQKGLVDYANSLNNPDKHVYDFDVQLNYLWKELKTTENAALKDLQKQKNTDSSTHSFMMNYERPDLSKANEPQRKQNASDVWNQLKDSAVSGSEAPADQAADDTGSCSCTTNSSPDAKVGKVVVLDPGHSINKTVVDHETGLNDVDSSNTATGERQAVWDVAQKAKTTLEQDGYTVKLTRNSEGEYSGMRDRAKVADDAKADIAVSIHGDPNLGHDGEIYVQKVGLYRGSGSNKTTFSDSDLAAKSQTYARNFKEAREKDGGGTVVIKDNSFDGRAPIEPGTIPLVELFSKSTPWVYNEMKMDFDKDKYAQGIVDGVEKSLGGSSDKISATGGATDNCQSVGNGDVLPTIFNYAYSDGRKTLTMKDTYKSAVSKAKAKGEYIGGIQYPGVDCGGFVTRAMRDSGTDKDYNKYQGPTSQQKKYMDDNPDKYQKIGSVTDTGKLQPGDIAITENHTYFYVGPEKEHPNFKGNAASASMDDYAPTANNTYFVDSHGVSFTWYRKI